MAKVIAHTLVAGVLFEVNERDGDFVRFSRTRVGRGGRSWGGVSMRGRFTPATLKIESVMRAAVK